ncbi:class I SAM-dependent methyltransferase [Reichenbachiella ulvae]|uniref:THUMP-like domain-containing protein n=1 Tax=Reichenbachiella ulvae TaxID=2980104 RepID=A0ABT3CX89_9BACT|nr:hypothetical protein [Reichenbachiella ulvae]MCV9388222.1 hypothetical protein [Reichenbachiella ulvae]
MINSLSKPEVRKFIQEHRLDDPAQLVLKAGKNTELPIREIAHQIKCWQKARHKLPTLVAHADLIYPPGVSLEQSSSEATAQYKARLISGQSLTDLTAGFGIDAYYLSQRFEQVIAIEQNPDLIPVVEHNLELLQAGNIRYVRGNAMDYLKEEKEPSDFYFLDPARRDGANQKVHLIEDCQPNLLEILPLLKQRSAKVLIKLAPLLDIQQALDRLPNVKEVHVVSVDNECKELLFQIDFEFEGEPKVVASNWVQESWDRLEFQYSDEREIASFSQPMKYIYEPNASIMKAGAFTSVGKQFGLSKLHRNSHLYTSEKVVAGFPGRVFEIEAVTVLNKKKLKPFLPNNKANITVRNYPNTVQEIRKKTSIKDGGSVYLFATTLMDGSASVLVCKKC